MDYMDKDLGKILKNNAQTLRHDLLPQGTDCFRVYDRNLSRYPVTVDLYGKYAKVTDYGQEPLSDEDRENCLDICARMLYLEKENVVYSHRLKRLEREQHEKSELQAVKTTVKENGLLFSVDLTTYVDTGLFLDHAMTRRLVMERSANADVLNLFSYTGSFSVYAAAGRANSVTSVDMSATYTKWAEENLQANGYSGDMYKCVCMDATRFVDDAINKGMKYDIIIFDPPSFSNSRKMESDFDVSRDYAIWIRKLFSILKRTGIILFSTNLGSFQMDRRRLRGLSVKEITGAFVAPGFVKGRAGTVRSWMMAFDDDSLSLDWSEPEKKSEKSTDSAKKDSGKSDYRRPEKKSYGERRDGEKRSYGRYDDRRQGERRYGDRDRDRRPSDRGYGERRYSSDERYGRSYDRKPYGSRNDQGERTYDRSERRTYDRPNNDRSERYSHHDRYDDNEQRKDRFRSRDDRPYNSDRPQRRERSFDREDRAEREDRPFRRERDDRQGERSFNKDRGYGERSRSRNYGEKRSFHQDGSETRERRDSFKSKKPYGYDSFKPARSREDSTDFFWNADDLDPKPKKED